MSIPTPFNPLGTLGAEVLPPGWSKVDSVLFADGAYVDTGFTVDATDSYSVDILVPKQPVRAGTGGSYDGPLSRRAEFVVEDSGYLIWVFVGNSSVKKTVALPSYRGLWKISPGKAELPGKGIVYLGDDTYESSNSKWLVCRAGFGYTLQNARVWGCTILRNGELVCNLVPVTDGTEYKLYDSVKKEFPVHFGALKP